MSELKLFAPCDGPRVFASPLGVDFSKAVIDGLRDRLQGHPPDALARVTLIVNAERLARRLRSLWAAGEATFLPKIVPITAISAQPDLIGLPPAMSSLALRLTLSRLVLGLLEQNADLAPRSSLYDLADSLAELMGEMQEEGVTLETLDALPAQDLSHHWQRNQQFLAIAARLFDGDAAQITPEMKQRLAVEYLSDIWAKEPPQTPIVVAGSTGSRGTTARFMQAVSRLPQGGVILPGCDFDLGAKTASALLNSRHARMAGEDHPQFRNVSFCASLDLELADLPIWSNRIGSANPGRNAWLSLALRPAPVTDVWRNEAPDLPLARAAFERVTLVRAPTLRAEAETIAFRLRQAAAEGQRAALVSPDRILTRQVATYLSRWGIVPDDSAGVPMDQTPPGRLLALAAGLLTGRVDAVDLLAVLKHPLTHSGDGRNEHLRRSRDLEIDVLRGKTAIPIPDRIREWAAKRSKRELENAQDVLWAEWLCRTLLSAPRTKPATFADFLEIHVALAEALAAGSSAEGSGELWEKENGESVRSAVAGIRTDAAAGGLMRPSEYRDMILAILSAEETRSPLRPDANIMIWGAMEARVQGADLMILAGLNEGIWPSADQADPWLSRNLRASAGLRLPDRRIGLSAHDFQQAAAAPEVWLSRATRNADAETVPSRWLNRLTNLLAGSEPEVLDKMIERGDRAVYLASRIDQPRDDEVQKPAGRLAPAPPAKARPRKLSVTQIERLVRDPYAIYAQEVLRLRALDPLRPDADARLKGTILHEIAHDFIKATMDGMPDDPGALFLEIGRSKFNRAEDWPTARQLWLAALANALPTFLAGEFERRADGAPWQLETKGVLNLPTVDFTLTARVDRIDRRSDGTLAIYDYKSGQVPTAKQEVQFNQQLQLEAVMAAHGAFAHGDPQIASLVAYIGLNASGQSYEIPLSAAEIAEAEVNLRGLIATFLDEDHGFTPRRAMQNLTYQSDFQHLARYGEWDDSSDILTEPVGR